MKVVDAVKVLVKAGFIAADKKPEDVAAALLAADASMPGNVASSKEITDKRAKDRKARDEKRASDRAAADKARDEEFQKAKDRRAADRKARDEKMAGDRKARDEKFGAEDRDDDPEHTNDEDMKAEDAAESEAEKKAEDEDYTEGADPGSAGHGGKPANPTVDSATVDARIAAAVEAERARGNELRIALDEVAPILGKVTFDSAPKAYRAALDHLKVDTKGVPDAALAALLKVAKGAAPAAPAVPAMDSAGAAALEKLIPGINRLK